MSVQGVRIGERERRLGVDDRVDRNGPGNKRVTDRTLGPRTPFGIVREDVQQDVGVHQEHSLFSTSKSQDIIGAEFAVGGAARLTKTFLDKRPFAQHRPDHHATITLVEGDVRVG